MAWSARTFVPVPLIAVVAPAAILAATVGHATTFLEQPLPTTVQQTPVIVRGKVEAGIADWSVGQDGTRRIYTFWNMNVEEVLKGDAPGGQITVRELGGEKDGIGLEIAGTVKFSPDEDVVLTLGSKNSDGSYDVRNMMMGKFDVRTDESGQEYIVGPGIPRGTRWTLAALRQLIDRQAHGESATPIPSPSPKVTAARSVTPIPTAAHDDQASQLQPSEEQKPISPSQRLRFWVVLAGIIAAVAIAARIVRRK